jgi:AcrR family transcriptional regulator
MHQNKQRRQAHRQKRGIVRTEEILHVAGVLFASSGYDKVTMQMIAQQSKTATGTLYQFFPNKEAVALEYAKLAVRELHVLYDDMMAPEQFQRSFPQFLDYFIDRLVSFNQTYPGYLALEVSAILSDALKNILAEMHHGIQQRLDALIMQYWPDSTELQRRLPLAISYRIFLALLPLSVQGDEEMREASVRELKSILGLYWGKLRLS